MYTQNAEQLERGFKKVLEKHSLKIMTGLNIGHLPLEDGIPYFEVYRSEEISLSEGRKIVQEMANEMDIQMFFASVENSDYDCCLKGYMDLDFEDFSKYPGSSVSALSDSRDIVEYIEEDQCIGKIIRPNA